MNNKYVMYVMVIALGMFTGAPCLHAAVGEPNALLLDAAKIGAVGNVLNALKAGANINTINFSGYTALMLAAMFGGAEVVKALLDLEADASLKNSDGKTALDLARLYDPTKDYRNKATLATKNANKAGIIQMLQDYQKRMQEKSMQDYQKSRENLSKRLPWVQ